MIIILLSEVEEGVDIVAIIEFWLTNNCLSRSLLANFVRKRYKYDDLYTMILSSKSITF